MRIPHKHRLSWKLGGVGSDAFLPAQREDNKAITRDFLKILTLLLASGLNETAIARRCKKFDKTC